MSCWLPKKAYTGGPIEPETMTRDLFQMQMALASHDANISPAPQLVVGCTQALQTRIFEKQECTVVVVLIREYSLLGRTFLKAALATLATAVGSGKLRGSQSG